MNPLAAEVSTYFRRAVARSLAVGALLMAVALMWGTSSSAQPTVSGGICDDWGCHSGEEKCMTIGPATCWDDED